MSYIIWLAGTDAQTNNLEHTLLGGKASVLAQLYRAGMSVPNGFVLLPAAFTDSLSPGNGYSPPTVSTAVKQELQEALAKLCPNGERVAVRSSARDEDGIEHSFAGQLDSFLDVLPEDVADKAIAVWQSAWSPRILAYRQEHGLPPMPSPPAVLIQQMVQATVSGVAFGADPMTGRRGVAVVSAVSGLGAALVSGESEADTYQVDRDGCIIQRQIAFDQPVLDDEQIHAIAALVRQVSYSFERPQDIEWAIAHTGEDTCPPTSSPKTYLLQSRPITTLAQLADPDGSFNLWDNSNIVESYSGVTTPLTFSFARKAYEEVYRQFCRFMGVPATAIAQHDDIFRCMIGLVQGRVYYNLLSWYRILALLPGYRLNSRFMEQMMGVREPLPDSVIAQVQQGIELNRFQDAWRLLTTLGGLVTNYFILPRRIQHYYQRIDQALDLKGKKLEDWRADELAKHYRYLEGQLLTHWDAPLITDFFAMIFYGVLRRLCEKWCGDRSGTLQNELIAGEGGVISAEPAQRMRQMAEWIGEWEGENFSSSVHDGGGTVTLLTQHQSLITLLCEGELTAILQVMEQLPEFKRQYEEYLQRFGDRCLEELKLESPTLHDDPLPLLRAVGQLARVGKQGEQGEQGRGRLQAEQRVEEALGLRPLRRLIFGWVLKNAREKVRDRENLRFERTRVFGRARRIFVELGRRFYALERLNSPRDIFYLEVNEILGFVEGNTTCTDLKGLVAVRQAEFSQYRELPPAASRFETRGIVYQGNTFQNPLSQNSTTVVDGDERQGMGCSPGTVRGLVRVVAHPQQFPGRNGTPPLQPGTILVAGRTDPGWIVLFSAAGGLLVEQGSPLSHVAIVSRELGLPMIVSLPDITRWLKDGDWIEMDGSTGKVCKVRN